MVATITLTWLVISMYKYQCRFQQAIGSYTTAGQRLKHCDVVTSRPFPTRFVTNDVFGGTGQVSDITHSRKGNSNASCWNRPINQQPKNQHSVSPSCEKSHEVQDGALIRKSTILWINGDKPTACFILYINTIVGPKIHST